MGVLRAEIVDAVTGTPAAWALVEARGPGQRLAIGVADADGRVLVPLPYPKPIVTVGSPATPGIPLTSQTWTIDVAVRYRRRPVTPAAPDLADVLMQPPATAWRDVARTTPLAQAPLRFGRDLVLASAAPDGSLTPTLLIDPASSPP
jgi:hypothetical protein